MEESRSNSVRRKSVRHLPTELLCSIGFKLDSAADRVRFRAVSKSWRSALPFRQPPWLVLPKSIPSEESQKVIKLFEFITVGDQTINTVDLPEINEARVVGSTGNWLITMQVDESVCLLNPFTKLQFRLPSHFQELHQPSRIQLRDRFGWKVVLSSSPHNAPDPNCIAIALHWNYNKLSIARLGDASWTDVVVTGCICSSFNNYFEDVVFYDRRFYAVTTDRKLVVCNIEDGLNPPKFSLLFECCIDESCVSYRLYLVECSGELLVVVRYVNRFFTNFEEPKYRTTSFKTYKVDFADMDNYDLKSLGDHSLFLGRNTSVSVLASDYFGLVRRNCIYFTDDIFVTEVDNDDGYVINLVEDDIGMFNMEDNSITPHYKGTSNSLFSLPVWIVPT